MTFTQIEFFIFIISILIAFQLVGTHQARKYILLLSNFYFYAYFEYRFLILLLIITISTYLIGRTINSLSHKVKQKLLVCIGVFLNLGVLFYFKYYNFFIENITSLLPNDFSNLHTIHLVIPVGVSFFTFRLISYIIDTYRREGEIVYRYDFIDFLIYATFFPIIVSGPISRVDNFIPQLEKIKLSSENFYMGFKIFVIGLFLKVFVADNIAPYVNYFYENHQIFNSVTAWISVLAYDVQIYCDFAGYSSMAIGISLILGFKIEENFNFPYIATSINEFWKRWHITLSEWIRDYVYIPLGGNRKGKVRKYFNLIIAMTLCGLWHGSAWTFILWGFIHGALLVVNHCWRELAANVSLKEHFSIKRSHLAERLNTTISWFFTFFSVSLCWIFFRSEDIKQAFEILHKLFLFDAVGLSWYQPFVIFVLLSSILFHLFYSFKPAWISLYIEKRTTLFLLFCMIWLVIVFYPKKFQPFIYAQF